MFSITNLQYRYHDKTILDIPTWRASQGESGLVTGNSGSGKTTLLHLLAGLLTPQTGQLIVAERDLGVLRGSQLDIFRGRNIGIVLQRLHLIRALTVIDNLLLTQYLAQLPQDKTHIMTLLKELDLADYSNFYPAQLSQGQAQRVAIARAVLNQPRLLLADEPTANLDDEHAHQVFNLLINQAKNNKATLIIASHDARAKNYLKVALHLETKLAGC